VLLTFSPTSEYEKNTLVLMVQSPRVLYVYWELSVGQRAALVKRGKLQLRLNVVNAGPFCVHEIMPQWDSFYFSGVESGCNYICDISVVGENCECYPLIYSNTVFTPAEGPATGHIIASSYNFCGTGSLGTTKDRSDNISSGVFYK